MNGLAGIGGVIAILLVASVAIGLLDRRNFSLRWLLVAALLVFVNDAALTRAYGLLPDFLPGSEWNWQGKLLALTITLGVAALPVFGWQRSGLTLRQRPGSLLACIPVALVYCGLFVALALAFPSDPASRETMAFQLTMPGLEEEPFYRGILLLALDQAYRGRVRFLGVDWGWGALLSCALFGLAHAFGYSDGGYSFDAMVMALTALPSLLTVWLRLRTGSLLLPVVIHNFGNSFSLLI